MASSYRPPPVFESYHNWWADHGEGSGASTDDTESLQVCYTPRSPGTLLDVGLDPTPAPAPMPPHPADNPTRSNKAVAAKPSPGTIEMRMIPEQYTPNPWLAVLRIECKDVPRLMREGFFWSAANVLPEEGYISDDVRPLCAKLGCRHKRTWTIADRPNDEASQWSGRIELSSPLLETVAQFRIADLSRASVFVAYGWNKAGYSTYRYDHRYPDHNYNCIYDDEPLEGWWPWPKEKEVDIAVPAVGAAQLFPYPPPSCSCCCEPERRLLRPELRSDIHDVC